MKTLITPSSSLKSLNQRNERVINFITYPLIVIVIVCGIIILNDTFKWSHSNINGDANSKISLDLNRIREISLQVDGDESSPRNPDCRFWDCINLYKCGHEHDQLTVYVYPLRDYVDEKSGKLATTLTSEYYQILKTVVKSHYYTSNPNEACLLLPSIDLLNQNLVDLKLVNRALASLEHWDAGKNHIIFNMIPSSARILNATKDDINSDQAIIVGSSFDSWTYRIGFDVAMPVWSPNLKNFNAEKLTTHFPRRYLIIVPQLNALPEQKLILQSFKHEHHKKLLLLESCSVQTNALSNQVVRCSKSDVEEKIHDYPRILADGTFCLLTRSLHLSQPEFLEILAYSCIPVVAIDNYVFPFADVIDWSLAAIHIQQSELPMLMQRLSDVSNVKILEMQQQIRWLYQRYFKNLQTITLTTLKILEDRIFPHHARSLKQWNTVDSNYRIANNPLFLPLIPPKTQGFTAVILTYDRVESLFTLIQKLSVVPSLQSILVIWNNQRKPPPHLSAYPSIAKPLKVIQTRANKLSNRFYPYAEIETEAILTIDDDIVMLTSDELDFGYEVWREFPDRIVGFPSRIHVWDNTTMRWHYESEWTNQISMVLTGAAFHHKFWSHMYTYHMPYNIKDWVDEHMNCEDIAMNFLVANITNKPPIKVTPRKKFKCPECTNTEMLSADLNHMRERSACIDRFAQMYGRMPLRSVEFRADPVLFKDNFPEKLKRFNDIGSL